NYKNKFKITINNKSKKNLKKSFEILWECGIGIDEKLKKENLRSMKVYFNTGKNVIKVKPSKKKRISLKGEWISLVNRYFFISFIEEEGRFFIEKRNSIPLVGIKKEIFLEKGGKEEIKIKFFASPKSYFLLKKEKKDFEDAMGFGVFGFLSIIFLKILKFFYSITGNYGWSIIILTLLINILTFPLTLKNLKSMHAMKKLQPYIEQLKKKYKDDPQKLQMELMHLYKIKGVNPLGGCLPLLLQIPIFWALFSMLRQTFELRGAHFILWIKDLASPDSFFGHIPEFIPIFGGWPVGPLPLLMGIMMYIQQKTQSTGDPQAKALSWMPIFFTLIFFQFPSGLVLYWLFNNILTFIEQKIFLKNIGG
ncbi:MAG: membrane protein insertase YidC, partial [Caldiserica bacterium]